METKTTGSDSSGGDGHGHAYSDAEWRSLFTRISAAIGSDYGASVNRIAESTSSHTPFRVLVSTLISLRTRDEVTFTASERLLAEASTPEALGALPRERIETLIYPAGFYRNKAKNLLSIAAILQETYGGRVPDTLEELLSLPGVGRKTANLVLGVGFGIPAICVDTHVHRIPNRLGLIATDTPEESERALMTILPKQYWIPINELLVGFGQQVCTPQSPWCSRCPLAAECPRIGVTRTR